MTRNARVCDVNTPRFVLERFVMIAFAMHVEHAISNVVAMSVFARFI